MNTVTDIALSPEEAANPEEVKRALTEKIGVNEPFEWKLLRRSIDARGKTVKIRLRCNVFTPDSQSKEKLPVITYPDVSNAREVIIAGAGPAGYFAALKLIERGLKPIVLERGKDVKERRKDLSNLNAKHIVNPDSNYCFGEGGAGTYSDGKLYTRSGKRNDIMRILQILVQHGAHEDILIDAHPHIGTNRLPKIVTALRQTIENAGGEVRFNNKVTDFIIQNGKLRGVITENGDTLKNDRVILATGHSARDIFELLPRRGVLIEPKPFALGVRVEHPQRLIDAIRYNCGSGRGKYLPAASYNIVNQVRSRGVYSFCMCPGGQIVPSATAPGEIVVNGMSTSTRSSRFANSGIVVSVEREDVTGFRSAGPLAFLRFQQYVERMMCESANGDQTAPAQRLTDFIGNVHSAELNKCSYIPGIAAAPLHEILPKFIRTRLQQGFTAFGKRMKGYITEEAQILAPESRTSSPVRIPRDPKTHEHTQIQGLFPCGEGAGYAGGIVSAAMDGERVAASMLIQP